MSMPELLFNTFCRFVLFPVA